MFLPVGWHLDRGRWTARFTKFEGRTMLADFFCGPGNLRGFAADDALKFL